MNVLGAISRREMAGIEKAAMLTLAWLNVHTWSRIGRVRDRDRDAFKCDGKQMWDLPDYIILLQFHTDARADRLVELYTTSGNGRTSDRDYSTSGCFHESFNTALCTRGLFWSSKLSYLIELVNALMYSHDAVVRRWTFAVSSWADDDVADDEKSLWSEYSFPI